MSTNEQMLSDHLSLTERVYVTLREMILNMELPPGLRLKDFELAKKLGVSNTPLREAMRRLAAESLVETIPRRGTFVRRLSIEEVRRLYEIREALEILAARLAAERGKDEMLKDVMKAAGLHRKAVENGDMHEYLNLDRRFHELIAACSNNDILVSILSSLADRIHIVRRMTSDVTKDLVTGKEHLEIAQALAARDSKKAAQLMKNHIRMHCERVVSVLRNVEIKG
ncbi:MAG: GntR family transcriptional regulator [Spirochaetota bacterium]